MLGGLLSTNLPFAPNAWKLWVDHIMKHKKDYNFKKASLIYDSGATAYASLGFIVHPAEVLVSIADLKSGNFEEKLCCKLILPLNAIAILVLEDLW